MKKEPAVNQEKSSLDDSQGMVFDVQRFSVHDGPGIRTLVFLKGCPLHCRWCANPESVNPFPELAYRIEECNSCGKCLAVCPHQALALTAENKIRIDRQLCDNCGSCLEVCYPHALFIYGKSQQAAGIFKEIKKDMTFYSVSSGGVTVSGGEPLLQPAFVKSIFNLCHENKIPTAIETSGYSSPEVFQDILGITDFVLFDLKCYDSAVHEKLCGKNNRLILENAAILARSGKPFLFRIPLIPVYNNTRENLAGIASYIKNLGPDQPRVELMPYHRMGAGKYEYLGRPYLLTAIAAPSEAEIQAAKAVFEQSGIRVI
jgi:pyruvate formate lyase activating enzyme